VFFAQERVGRDGGTFTLYKLRTMVVDAESRRAELEADNERGGPLFKLSDDPRVTRFGRLLRATSIDEIPQLFNVLQGAMSLVGPRPALPSEVEEFDDDLRRRTRVKPGVTGLWQVEARDSENFDLYRRYDLLYVDNWSVTLDLAILARTVAAVGLRGLGAVGLLSRGRASGAMLD
jgi:lipopolysaccharide/colanic/teichoic acid biosynthesis glycosyltransferase